VEIRVVTRERIENPREVAEKIFEGLRRRGVPVTYVRVEGREIRIGVEGEVEAMGFVVPLIVGILGALGISVAWIVLAPRMGGLIGDVKEFIVTIAPLGFIFLATVFGGLMLYKVASGQR